jgi:hypothetical protein
MDGRNIEPRNVMWAVAEITWEDDGGTSIRVPAILEDTSRSGACIRIKRPVAIGARLTVKWHREQFSGIARNCRKDGGDFLLGVRREADIVCATKPATGQQHETQRIAEVIELCGKQPAPERSSNAMAAGAAAGNSEKMIRHPPVPQAPRGPPRLAELRCSCLHSPAGDQQMRPRLVV